MVGGAVSIPFASADPCPDIEVVFARGTAAPPGISAVGQAFVDSLRSQVGGRTIGVYAVDYPASLDFDRSTNAGATDASARVESIAATCPSTKIVLGGYSQGADVVDLITAEGAPAWGVPTPMPPAVADHVAAVVVFGNPSTTLGGGPLTATSRLYRAKAIDLCMPGDPICSDGLNLMAHGMYVDSGMAGQAATFAASRL
jgi:cutinase